MFAPQLDEEEIFHVARRMTPGESRGSYVREVAGNDKRLVARVEALLRIHDEDHDFLEPTATGSPTVADVPMIEGPGQSVGPYELREIIGEGGFGVVFLAEQQQAIRRQVALKVIKPGMDTRQVIARFEAERQALALMEHPNIARVLDGGQTASGRPFFVMELVRGNTITDYCDNHHLTVRQRLELFLHVCHAVQHAHQKGIIHRDVKPSNVLVTLHDGMPVVKVIDFGVAKAMGQQLTDKSLLTNTAHMIGTPLYMSPEQAEMSGLDIDTRADIYALGVLLYELLTGTTPFERERIKNASYDEIRRIIREEEPAKPSTRISTVGAAASTLSSKRQSDPVRLRRLLRGELDWIVMKCLEKDRTRRYDTAGALARDIQRHLSNEPVEAGPPSTTYRLRKLVRKHWRLLAVAGAFALLLAIGSGVSIALAVWARRAEKSAEDRLAQVEKGIDILTSVFEKLDPRAEERENRPLRALLGDQLSRAADQLEEEAVGDPILVAGLQNKLGMSLLRLGSPDRAIPLLARSRATRAAILGPEHDDTLDAANNLARAYQDAGKPDQALPLFEELWQMRKAQFGPDHPETLVSLNNLALGYHSFGMPGKALPLLEESLRIRKAAFAADHPSILTAMNNLAAVYADAQQLDEAIRLHEETLNLRRARLGAEHSDTLNSMSNLANAYKTAGRLQQALPLFEETLTLQRKTLATDHPDTLTTMTNLATGYRADGQVDKAIPLQEEAHKLWSARMGPHHPSTITSMNNLAVSYSAAGQPDRAIPLLEEALKLRSAQSSADHPSTLNNLNNLATAYQAARQLDKAIPLLEQSLKLRRARFGADHIQTFVGMTNLAAGYEAAGKLELAAPLFEQAAAGMERRGFRHQHAAPIVNNFAGCLERMREFDKAETWRRKMVAAVREESGADSVAYAAQLALLASNLVNQRKWDEAETLGREALATLEKKAADAWTTFHARAVLGGAALGQRKYSDAEPLLLQGYEGMKAREAKMPKNEASRLTQALEQLVNLYDAIGNAEEAAKWRQELETRNARQNR
jgi:serine/threonine protein kinase/tetratricopeptide (TPR) repeat protein